MERRVKSQPTWRYYAVIAFCFGTVIWAAWLILSGVSRLS